MPRPPKSPPDPTAEPPREPQKPTPPTPPLQPLQIIKKGSTLATPPKPPEKPTAEEARPHTAGAVLSTRPKPSLKRPVPKAEIPVIEKATGADGDVFNPGDRVEIAEPFGTRVAATIESFYADTEGEIWARVKPVEVNPNCRWEQGCLRSTGLIKILD